MPVLGPKTCGAACGNGYAVRMRGEVLHTHAQTEHDIEILQRRFAEYRLQIAAMNDPIWRAVTLCRFFAERNAHDFTSSARTENPYPRRRHNVGPQTIGQPKADQDASGVWGKLNLGAGLFEPF